MAVVESSSAAAGPLKGLDNESERQHQLQQQPDTVTALPAFREEDGEKPTAWQQKLILQTLGSDISSTTLLTE